MLLSLSLNAPAKPNFFASVGARCKLTKRFVSFVLFPFLFLATTIFIVLQSWSEESKRAFETLPLLVASIATNDDNTHCPLSSFEHNYLENSFTPEIPKADFTASDLASKFQLLVNETTIGAYNSYNNININLHLKLEYGQFSSSVIRLFNAREASAPDFDPRTLPTFWLYLINQHLILNNLIANPSASLLSPNNTENKYVFEISNNFKLPFNWNDLLNFYDSLKDNSFYYSLIVSGSNCKSLLYQDLALSNEFTLKEFGKVCSNYKNVYPQSYTSSQIQDKLLQSVYLNSHKTETDELQKNNNQNTICQPFDNPYNLPFHNLYNLPFRLVSKVDTYLNDLEIRKMYGFIYGLTGLEAPQRIIFLNILNENNTAHHTNGSNGTSNQYPIYGKRSLVIPTYSVSDGINNIRNRRARQNLYTDMLSTFFINNNLKIRSYSTDYSSKEDALNEIIENGINSYNEISKLNAFYQRSEISNGAKNVSAFSKPGALDGNQKQIDLLEDCENYDFSFVQPYVLKNSNTGTTNRHQPLHIDFSLFQWNLSKEHEHLQSHYSASANEKAHTNNTTCEDPTIQEAISQNTEPLYTTHDIDYKQVDHLKALMEARLGKIWIPENRYFGLASTKDYNLDHYDFRFFKDITKDDQAHHLAILHRLMRVWFRLCLQFNIPSWINHGSIIGWYFNGLSLPWDADIDVQVPIQSLYKLSKTINNTLIYDYTDFGTFEVFSQEKKLDSNAEFGLRGFYFDVNENFLLRNQIGNPNVNNIDARLIDIESGVYIDITALTDFTSQTNNELITKLLLIDSYTENELNKLSKAKFYNEYYEGIRLVKELRDSLFARKKSIFNKTLEKLQNIKLSISTMKKILVDVESRRISESQSLESQSSESQSSDIFGKHSAETQEEKEYSNSYLDYDDDKIQNLEVSEKKLKLFKFGSVFPPSEDLRNSEVYQKTNRLFEDFFHNMVHCRNYHYYKIEELTPLIPTYYENTITYLPANFLKNIVIEYDTKSINKLEFNDYKFFKYLQLWISSGDCDFKMMNVDGQVGGMGDDEHLGEEDDDQDNTSGVEIDEDSVGFVNPPKEEYSYFQYRKRHKNNGHFQPLEKKSIIEFEYNNIDLYDGGDKTKFESKISNFERKLGKNCYITNEFVQGEFTQFKDYLLLHSYEIEKLFGIANNRLNLEKPSETKIFPTHGNEHHHGDGHSGIIKYEEKYMQETLESFNGEVLRPEPWIIRNYFSKEEDSSII
ncbi:uncharacterized protein ASCRUDRAFT_122894 [Ascoidea rubescens DSM 1968]|uniref:LicD/FKTN/FKRP nucleotidyltransferase domain-containing protein n=1 Tax=Ascoidea rubescens DSM 1968 TaxID=1344418 RepID=A0A1D2VM57_9ASCO|nr:hypothetical protein ASCRUDRAFT_122894 [Ascoidea rubescens DSM 1968]ODV62692.1 hypothetical protein ASCRUDRAFT_122894 [Ascoidea rubescens DSM 1968]